ncbi:hypothetical protein D9619_007422 [Psilocybe cf. subviscida]|uniref:Uncharacterized protein n=1 Tax=Psilocybe cf. subviscida TaxID=2480587 RepID=A0A8H5B1P9_9AGAR|nr:hypothetical protein D9619_007422 [Psilocybe cf. subviscida]
MATHPVEHAQNQPGESLGMTPTIPPAPTTESLTTLEAIEKLVNATVNTANDLPAHAPNALQIKEIATQLKDSLTVLKKDTTILRRLFFAKKSKKGISDLNTKITKLDDDIKASTTELQRINEECKRRAGEIMDAAAKAHGRSHSYNEFHRGLLKVVKDALNDPNFDDPGPEPGRIVSQKAIEKIVEVSDRETERYNRESAARAEAERRKNEPQSLPPPPRKYSKAKLITE